MAESNIVIDTKKIQDDQQILWNSKLLTIEKKCKPPRPQDLPTSSQDHEQSDREWRGWWG